MSPGDRILLRKRSVMEIIHDELKNSCQAAHSRHRSLHSFSMDLIAALGAYCFFDKKLAICFERDNPAGQLELFC
jgi:hypothetical protein